MRPAHLVALLVMNIFWAGSYTAFKVLTERLTPGEVATWRYGLSAVMMAVLWRWLPGTAPGRRDQLAAAVIGAFTFVASPRLQVLGVQLGSASDASVVVALEPLVTAVAAALVLREHIPLRRWLGFSLGMLGIAMLHGAWRLDLHGPALLASLVFLSSFLCESVFSVVGKPLLQRCSAIRLVAVSLFWGSLLNLLLDGPGSLAKAPSLRPIDWAALAYLAVLCTLVGYTLWYLVIRETEVNLAALTILVQPLCGVLLAFWVVGEALHWGQFWGVVAILLGLTVGLNLRRTRSLAGGNPQPAPEPAPADSDRRGSSTG